MNQIHVLHTFYFNKLRPINNKFVQAGLSFSESLLKDASNNLSWIHTALIWTNFELVTYAVF